MSDFDHVLKELGELYEFNREIRKFKFVNKAAYEAGDSDGMVAENAPGYKTGKD